MNIEIIGLEDKLDLDSLCRFNDILNILNLEKSDIIAYYKHSWKTDNDFWIESKDFYLTKSHIIISNFKNNDFIIELIPLGVLDLTGLQFKCSAQHSYTDEHTNPQQNNSSTTLQLDEICFNSEIDNILPKPINQSNKRNYQNNYIDFKNQLFKLLSE